MRRFKAHARGNALLETMVSLLVLTPFLGGIVVLGKQLDVKHKTYDAVRYSAWERTVWSAASKSDADIALEAQDRSFGHPLAGVSPASALAAGISQNPLWRRRDQSLLMTQATATLNEREAPVEAGYTLVPALAHGDGFAATAARALQLGDLELNRRAFFGTTINATFHSPFNNDQTPLIQAARGAVLSDTWSSRNENDLRRRVDNLTANELIEDLELPGRPLAMQAPRKGGPLYGEGQYSWDPDLRPRSTTLPAAYVTHRENE